AISSAKLPDRQRFLGLAALVEGLSALCELQARADGVGGGLGLAGPLPQAAAGPLCPLLRVRVPDGHCQRRGLLRAAPRLLCASLRGSHGVAPGRARLHALRAAAAGLAQVQGRRRDGPCVSPCGPDAARVAVLRPAQPHRHSRGPLRAGPAPRGGRRRGAGAASGRYSSDLPSGQGRELTVPPSQQQRLASTAEHQCPARRETLGGCKLRNCRPRSMAAGGARVVDSSAATFPILPAGAVHVSHATFALQLIGSFGAAAQ
ncbi:unnamed protein product, partial [Prorocentrum cordatum]